MTTEIYTYCHTLSLHDALPIYFFQYSEAFRRFPEIVFFEISLENFPDHFCCFSLHHDFLQFLQKYRFFADFHLLLTLCLEAIACQNAIRSEEPPSELQSLMRISYSVL